MGKFETALKVGLQFAHLLLLVGKFETALKIGLQFAHLLLLVGKFETVLEVGIQFAHLSKSRYPICPPFALGGQTRDRP